jgi:hypothetical protein
MAYIGTYWKYFQCLEDGRVAEAVGNLRLQRAIRVSSALAAKRNVTQQAEDTLEDMKILRLRMNWNMNDSWVK